MNTLNVTIAVIRSFLVLRHLSAFAGSALRISRQMLVQLHDELVGPVESSDRRTAEMANEWISAEDEFG